MIQSRMMLRNFLFVKSGPSEAVLELGRQYAREDRSRGFGPHDQQPMLYYTANHITGKPERSPAKRVRTRTL